MPFTCAVQTAVCSSNCFSACDRDNIRISSLVDLALLARLRVRP